MRKLGDSCVPFVDFLALKGLQALSRTNVAAEKSLRSYNFHSNVAEELLCRFNITFANGNEIFLRLREISISWAVSAKLIEPLASFYQCSAG
jgi:hypothetical protein